MVGFVLASAPLDVFGQMALDEALAQSRPDAFCLRFFRWQGVGATFGYAQRVREVESALPAEIGDSFTRRPTGGGIVLHVDDLTFSCVFPAGGTWRPLEIYRRLHTAILAGLRRAGLAAGLCAESVRPVPYGPGGASQCFVQPVAMDILAAEGKILGGALRRHGPTVLYQGSLRFPHVRHRAAELESEIQQSLADEWHLQWDRRAADPAVAAQAAALASKYRSPAWIRMR